MQDYDLCPAHKNQKSIGSQDPKMTSPLTIEVPHHYTKDWKSKLEAMCSAHSGGQKKCKRVEMEQCETRAVAGGQVTSDLKAVDTMYDACKDFFFAANKQQEKASKKLSMILA